MGNTITIDGKTNIDVAAIWGGITGTLTNQTDLVSALGTKVANVNQSNIIWVGKHGSDANDGLTQYKAKLTFGGAIAAISGNTTSNRFVIACLDSGTYSLASNTISDPFTNSGAWAANTISVPNFCGIYAPNASIVGSVCLLDETFIECFSITSQATNSVPSTFDYKLGSCVVKAKGNQTTEGIGKSYAKIKKITNYGGSAISNWANLGTLIAEVGSIDVYQQNGTPYIACGLGDALQANGFGTLIADVGIITCQSANSYAAMLSQLGMVYANVKRVSLVAGYRIYHTAGTFNFQDTKISVDSWGSSPSGYFFDGTDDYIATNFTVPAIPAITALGWFKTSKTGANMMIVNDINSGGASADARAVFGVTSSNKFWFILGNGSADWNDTTSVSSLPYQDGKRHHFALVLNGTSVKLYIDSVLIANLTSTVAFGTAGSYKLHFGRAGEYNGLYFQGELSGQKLANYALSENYVKALFNNGLFGADIELADKYGGTKYISDFTTAGASGWQSFSRLDGHGNEDNISDGTISKSDCGVFYASDTTTNWKRMQMNTDILKNSQSYSMSCWYYIPAANTKTAGFRFCSNNDGTGATFLEQRDGTATPAVYGAWTFAELSFQCDTDFQTIFCFLAQKGTGAIYYSDNTANKLIYFKDIKITKSGCVLDFDMQTAGSYSVFDKSGNGYHGSVSGATPISRNQIVKAWKPAITGDTTLTNFVTYGYNQKDILIENTSGNTVTFSIGTTAGGTDVVNAQALAGGAKILIQLNKFYSRTANQTLYISSANWNSSSLNTSSFHEDKI